MSEKHDKGNKQVAPRPRQSDLRPVKPPIFKNRGGTGSIPPDALGNTLAFYLDDFNRTLFPLKTNREIIVRGESDVKEYIRKCLDGEEIEFKFLPQRRVYGAKPGLYLRRTVKLDPVAEYYIYDVIFRNRALFRKPHSAGRTHYGYRFEGGMPIPPASAYKAFKGAIADYSRTLPHSMSFDVATYFNGIYHHDIVSWFAELGASTEDSEGLGQILREIKSGRSLDCLPQGLYPTKMIGNDFLRFIDNNYDLRSNNLVRFMDDIHLFADDEQKIADDFQVIQRLLGEKGLSITPQKTQRDTAPSAGMDGAIDAIKKTLLKRRRLLIADGYDDDGQEIVKEVMLKHPLTDKELSYIDEILAKPDIEEDDAELILSIMHDHTNRVESRLPYIIHTYPHLAKNVCKFCAGISDKEMVADIILNEVKNHNQIMEFQLFWFGVILEEYLMNTSKTPEIISRLMNHKSATVITKSKVLEIADNRFGLPELRNDFLASGQSDWLAWSSAVGSRSLKATSKNHCLKYFGNSSQMNHLIATIMLKA